MAVIFQVIRLPDGRFALQNARDISGLTVEDLMAIYEVVRTGIRAHIDIRAEARPKDVDNSRRPVHTPERPDE